MNRSSYVFEYPVKDDAMVGADVDGVYHDRKVVRIEVNNGVVCVSLLEGIQHYERGELHRELRSLDEAYFYLKDQLLPHGQFTLPHPNGSMDTLSREMIHALIDGDLTLKIAKNAVDILLPLICQKSPEVFRIIMHLEPTFEAYIKHKKRAKKK